LLVRGDSGRLAALGEDPDVEFRGGVFTQPKSGVALVPVLVRIGAGEEPENLYEAWVNESPGGAREVLQALAADERLALYLYGSDGGLERFLRVPNPLRVFAGEVLRMTAGLRPMCGDAFHEARTAVYKQHPTTRALWRALKA
jgi:hypothetical protein